MEFKDLVKKDFGIELDSNQLSQFERYFELLVSWNEKMNLTGITERNEVYIKHFYDSLSLCKSLDLTKEMRMCDVGSGAGFPAIPIKIAFPNVEVVIVDSLNKRINFLSTVIHELGLHGIEAIHARAEDYTKDNRETFDLVTARAVARLNMLIELCSGLVKVDGYFIAMKASSGLEELDEAKNAINKLGFKLENTVEFKLPIEDSARTTIKCKKSSKTNSIYPRTFAQIKNKPL